MEYTSRLLIYLTNGKILSFSDIDEDTIEVNNLSDSFTFEYYYNHLDGSISQAAGQFKWSQIAGYVITSSPEELPLDEHVVEGGAE